MTDRELLELAAKAAGFPPSLLWYVDDVLCFNGDPNVTWNPLEDDGDALRVAVTCGLEIYHSINCDQWTVFVGYPCAQRIMYISETWEKDQYAATRRAIVRTAAEIGKQMKETK